MQEDAMQKEDSMLEDAMQNAMQKNTQREDAAAALVPELLYFHDPMCSWCWAWVPTLERLLAKLPPGLVFRRVLGGLAPDTDEPMSEEMRIMVQRSWRRIQEQVPGTELNFAFWSECQPRRATHVACRAVIAARRQDPAWEIPMTRAIQRAYYTQARNPSDVATLLELAKEIGLDRDQFAEDLPSASVRQELAQEMRLAHDLDVDSFPTLILRMGTQARPIPIDYRHAEPSHKAIVTAMTLLDCPMDAVPREQLSDTRTVTG